MSSLIINPSTEKDFETALNLLTEFGKNSRPMSMEQNEVTSFIFLMNNKGNSGNTNAAKGNKKKA
ncbi:MAG: hypothetical protein MUF39_12010 [Cyclobacteriaceae bacterium]|jgi:hypothetical protein|nr:hypothetical protein [Cyclobacteriaceae bacterium]